MCSKITILSTEHHQLLVILLQQKDATCVVNCTCVAPENIHTHPTDGWPLEILRGWEASKAKISKESLKLKRNF